MTPIDTEVMRELRGSVDSRDAYRRSGGVCPDLGPGCGLPLTLILGVSLKAAGARPAIGCHAGGCWGPLPWGWSVGGRLLFGRPPPLCSLTCGQLPGDRVLPGGRPPGPPRRRFLEVVHCGLAMCWTVAMAGFWADSLRFGMWRAVRWWFVRLGVRVSRGVWPLTVLVSGCWFAERSQTHRRRRSHPGQPR